MAAMFYESFVLRNKMAAVLSFSPVGAEMAEEHVYLSLFPQCLWGKRASAANAVELRPLMADTP